MSTYTDYLASPEWKHRRAAAISRANGRCQVCNIARGLHVHHRTYVRLYDEAPEDLTVICGDCHARHHGVLAVVPEHATVASPLKPSDYGEPWWTPVDVGGADGAPAGKPRLPCGGERDGPVAFHAAHAVCRRQNAAATQRHIDLGMCPDTEAPGDRDPRCPVCIALGPANRDEEE